MSSRHYIIELTHKLPYEKRDRAHVLTHIDQFYSIHDDEEGNEVEYSIPLTEGEVSDLYSSPPSNLDKFYEDVIDEIPEYDVDTDESSAATVELPETEDQDYQRMRGLVKEAEPHLGKVKTGVIDTGYDRDFPLNVSAGASFVSGEPADKTENPHGMHVAGSASLGGRTRLYMAKALGNDGRGYSSAIAKAIEWMISHEVDTIVMSLSGPYRAESPYHKPIARAVEKGIRVKVAAGNTGKRERRIPAAVPGAEAISAFTRWTDEPADYTTYGDHLYQGASGTSVLSYVLGGKMARFSGTSMAAPNNAAVTNCLIALYERPSLVRRLQLETSRKVEGVPNSYYGGHGVVDGDAANRRLKAAIKRGKQLEHLLVVIGKGEWTSYWVKVSGDAKFSTAGGGSKQASDEVYEQGDGSTILRGAVAGGRDAIEFDGDVQAMGFDTVPVVFSLVR